MILNRYAAAYLFRIMKHSYTTFQVLLAISIGLIDGVIEIVETGYLMGKRPEFKWSYQRFEGLEKSDLVNKLYSLNRQGLIEKAEDKYFLTRRGKAKFSELNVMYTLNLPSNIPWKGTWYLCSFDIPENAKKDRDKLRKILLQAGFIRIHQSLYVYPHNINNHISKIRSLFPKRHLVVIESDSVEITYLVYKKFLKNKIIK